MLRETLTVKYHPTSSHITNEAIETDCFSLPSIVSVHVPTYLSFVYSVLALLSVTCPSEWKNFSLTFSLCLGSPEENSRSCEANLASQKLDFIPKRFHKISQS